MNACAFGLITQAKQEKFQHIYAAKNGINGLIYEDLLTLNHLDDNQLTRLANTPASAFGSCRTKLPSWKENPDLYQKIFKTFDNNNITHFVYQGGNDSQSTVDKLSEYAKAIAHPIKIIGLAKTIDNDLYGTDFAPGFPSACQYLINTLIDAGMDLQAMQYAKSSTKVFILETMGRHVGHLAASTGLVSEILGIKPIILIPEKTYSEQEIKAAVDQKIAIDGLCLLVVSEGYSANWLYQKDSQKATYDAFGHKQLGGIGHHLSEWIGQQNIKCHYCKPSLVQRASMQNTSTVDRDMSIKLGQEALRYLLQNNHSSCMLGFERITINNKIDWTIKAFDLKDCANTEVKLPKSFYDEQTMCITEKAKAYFLPLFDNNIHPSQYIQPSELLKAQTNKTTLETDHAY